MEDKELDGFVKENGFEVVDEVQVGDLTDLKEERSILPPSKNVMLRIRKVSIVDTNKDFRMLNISLTLEEGIRVGEEMKFKGMIVWSKVTYYANPEGISAKTGKKYGSLPFFQKNQHLTDLKKLVLAVGGDVSKIKVNDEFVNSLTGRVILADIRQTMGKDFTAKDGTKVKGEVQNTVSNYKAIPADQLI